MNHARPFAKIKMLAAGIVLLAVFFRVFRLDEFPPALYWDEAFDGLDALRVLQTGSAPVFWGGNYGREPLAIYLQAAGILLWGARAWTLRIVPAMVGIATVPLLYCLGATLFAGDRRARNIGVLAAGMLAVSFWHVELSRLSLRIVTFPILSMLVVYVFWRAWDKRRLRDFATSGGLLGLTLYTYLASRLLPAVLIGFACLRAILPPAQGFPKVNWRPGVFGLALLFAVAGIVFLPLGIYFLQNPGAFSLRTENISVFTPESGGWVTVLNNAINTVRMFVDRGDMQPRHNLPGRPALDAFAALGFWIGLGVMGARFTSRPVYALLGVWLAVSLIPSLFSLESPHFLRTAGALPPVLLIAADGLTWVWERTLPRLNVAILLAIVILGGGVLTYNDYFNRWGPSQQTFESFDGSRQIVLAHALALTETRDVVLPMSLYGTPNAQFYLAGRFGVPQPLQSSVDSPATWLALGGAERTVVVLQKDGRAVVPQPLSPAQTARLNELLATGRPLSNPFGQPIATEVQIADTREFMSTLKPTYPVDAVFGGRIKMLGYDLDPQRLAPGDKSTVTYYWQALADGEFDYWVSTTMLDSFSNPFTQRLSEPVYGFAPTSLWRRGAIFLDSAEIKVPTYSHQGKYRYEVGLINRAASDQPLALSPSQDRLLLDPFTVVRPAPDSDAIAHPLTIRLGEPPLMTLIGYDLDGETARPGKPLSIRLYWRSERKTPTDYSVFLHLRDARGNMIAQQDSPPQNGFAPTSWWRPGEMIVDTHELGVPSGTLLGRYMLAIGVYNSADGERLPVFDSAGNPLPERAWSLTLEITNP